MNIDNDLLNKCKNINSGESEIILKSLYLYLSNNKLVTVKELKEYLSVSEKMIYSYINGIKSKFNFGKPSNGKIPINIKNIKKSKKEFIKMGKKENYIKEKKRTKRQKKTKILADEILEPYYKELRKRGLGGVITDKYRKINVGIMRKVKKEYKNLSNQDILNTLKMALDDDYLQKTDNSTSLKVIFFSGVNMVEKYLKHKENKYKIINAEDKPVKESMFGYFLKKDNTFNHIAPKNKNAPYYKIKKELKNRMLNNVKNDNLSKYFDNNNLKDKYKWMIGETGKSNKFVNN